MAQTHVRPLPLEFLLSLGSGYSRALTTHPLLVKSITSGIIAALGNLVAQRIGSRAKNLENDEGNPPLKLRSILAYAIYGSTVSGPLTHFFLNWLAAHGPSNPILKLILDRFGFGSIILAIALYLLPRLEGSKHKDAMRQLRKLYWSALIMSYKIWIPFQFINLNYVPLKYRVLVINLVSFGWNIYLSKKRANAGSGPTETRRDYEDDNDEKFLKED